MIGETSESAVSREVISLVNDYAGLPLNELTHDKRLLHDLEVVGDDFFDFIEKFEKKFNIDLSSVEWPRFNYGEGIFSIPFLYTIKKKQKYPGMRTLTVGHLVKVAHKGSWFEPNGSL